MHRPARVSRRKKRGKPSPRTPHASPIRHRQSSSVSDSDAGAGAGAGASAGADPSTSRGVAAPSHASDTSSDGRATQLRQPATAPGARGHRAQHVARQLLPPDEPAHVARQLLPPDEPAHVAPQLVPPQEPPRRDLHKMLQYLPLPRYSGSEATAKLDVHVFLQQFDACLEGESLSDREAALLMRHQLEGSARSLANSNAAAANSHVALSRLLKQVFGARDVPDAVRAAISTPRPSTEPLLAWMHNRHALFQLLEAPTERMVQRSIALCAKHANDREFATMVIVLGVTSWPDLLAAADSYVDRQALPADMPSVQRRVEAEQAPSSESAIAQLTTAVAALTRRVEARPPYRPRKCFRCRSTTHLVNACTNACALCGSTSCRGSSRCPQYESKQAAAGTAPGAAPAPGTT